MLHYIFTITELFSVKVWCLNIIYVYFYTKLFIVQPEKSCIL